LATNKINQLAALRRQCLPRWNFCVTAYVTRFQTLGAASILAKGNTPRTDDAVLRETGKD